MRVIVPIAISCIALILMSCSPSIQDVNIKAEGTIEFHQFDGEPFSVDLAKCWQRSFWQYDDGGSQYVLDIVCDEFTVYSRFDDFPPESRELVDFSFPLWWNTKVEGLKENCASNTLFSSISSKKVTVSKHNGEAPYTYHLTTAPLTSAPDETACAVYDVKIRVLSEPSGGSYDTPDLPPEAYGQ